MIQKLRYESILRRLKQEGFRLSEFSMVSEGDYAAEDADWNYKDVPHLAIVHSLADTQPILLDHDISCTINLQNILGIWFPVVVNVYESEKNVAVYYTTLFFFILAVETRMEEIAPLRTRVTTTYNIAAPRWLAWAAPILRWIVKRNYGVLMSEDLPMRDRRGALRKLGYRFAKQRETYGFLETTRLYDSNVKLPEGAQTTHSADYAQAFGGADKAFLGDIGLLGLKLTRDGDTVTVWPRTCPHEGASLDAARCTEENKLFCPWHGRLIPPVGTFTWGSDSEFASGDYRIRTTGHTITWDYAPKATQKAEAA